MGIMAALMGIYIGLIEPMLPDPGTVQSVCFDKNTIIEALKAKDINNIDNNKLISIQSYDKLIKYRQFY